MDLRIFVEPQQGTTYRRLAALAREAEALGFDGFFTSDHYRHMGDGDGGPGPTDAWTTLAGLARDTERLRLGTLLTPVTFRLPGPLAIAVAQIDEMSDGRVELGLGAGWYDDEHTAYGIPFPPLGERFERLEEQIAIITGLWATPVGATFDFAGAHYRVEGSPALAKPVQHPRPPIVMGGFGPKRTPRLAARYADEFNLPFSPLEGFTAARDNVLTACEAAGRVVDELRENGVAGTPAECVERLGALGEAGAERGYLQTLDDTDLDHLRLVAAEVAPHV